MSNRCKPSTKQNVQAGKSINKATKELLLMPAPSPASFSASSLLSSPWRLLLLLQHPLQDHRPACSVPLWSPALCPLVLPCGDPLWLLLLASSAHLFCPAQLYRTLLSAKCILPPCWSSICGKHTQTVTTNTCRNLKPPTPPQLPCILSII